MSRRRRATLALGLGAGLAMGGLTLVGTPVASYAAVTGDDCEGVAVDQPVADEPTDPSVPLESMQMDDAQRIARRLAGGTRTPGEGVVVAVVDSGVYINQGRITYADRVVPEGFSTPSEASYNQGTAVAGVIAGGAVPDVGPIGVAPGAEIFDVRVYDVPASGDDDLEKVTAAGIAAGLRGVLPSVGTAKGDVRIVTVPVVVRGDDADLRSAVDAVTKAGAIVVAAAGDRAGTDIAYEYGEDAAATYFPAGYSRGVGERPANPRVLTVGTTNAEGSDQPPGFLSSAIDVVVPTLGALSYAYTEDQDLAQTCAYYRSSTAIAAGEVSGVLAMLMTAYPDATQDELVARLKATATRGATLGSIPDRAQGHGIVQPVEALTRRLPANPKGEVLEVTAAEPEALPAPLPVSEPDVLRSTRRNAVWWGLFGGGALVVALLLRPVLSRRRGR